jgi:hypothetical protein
MGNPTPLAILIPVHVPLFSIEWTLPPSPPTPRRRARPLSKALVMESGSSEGSGSDVARDLE